MAPRRKGAHGQDKRVEAFLRDFDREVEMRVARIKAEEAALLQELDDAFQVELLRLPRALREMNWLRFFALSEKENGLQEAVSTDLDIAEITELASQAVQTPLKTIRKAKKVKQDIQTISEEVESEVLPAMKRARQDGTSEPPDPAPLHKAGKAKASAKKVPASKRSKPPSARSTRFSKSRPSRDNFVTPASQAAHAVNLRGSTAAFTPKFDSSVFKTPGLRVPACHEPVLLVSTNGSPLVDNNVSITVPIGGGENLHLRAHELSRRNLMQLNPDALGRVEKLSAQLVNLISGLKSHK